MSNAESSEGEKKEVLAVAAQFPPRQTAKSQLNYNSGVVFVLLLCALMFFVCQSYEHLSMYLILLPHVILMVHLHEH